MVTDDRQYSRQQFRGNRCAVVGHFEPQNRRAEDAAFAEVVAHPRLDRAEVFTDDERAGAMRLEGKDADHRPMVVVDVGAFGWLGALAESTTAGTAR